jgi:hypothetical protein
MKIDPAEVARMTISGIENPELRRSLGEDLARLTVVADEILRSLGAGADLPDRKAGEKALEAVELLGRRIMEKRL